MLAQLVHDEIAAATGIAARGARSDTKLYNTGLYVLRNSTVPAILVEMGYVNHGSDAKLLSDTGFQGQTASAIVDAVIRYLGGPASSKAEGPG
jgi:N-acetylmuramoyl-L-alanine amidase